MAVAQHARRAICRDRPRCGNVAPWPPAHPAPPVPLPNDAALHEAALAYLARYAATEAGLTRTLRRAVDRWARRALADGAEADAVAAQAAQSREAVRGRGGAAGGPRRGERRGLRRKPHAQPGARWTLTPRGGGAPGRQGRRRRDRPRRAGRRGNRTNWRQRWCWRGAGGSDRSGRATEIRDANWRCWRARGSARRWRARRCACRTRMRKRWWLRLRRG